jgi:hypothetical protein
LVAGALLFYVFWFSFLFIPNHCELFICNTQSFILYTKRNNSFAFLRSCIVFSFNKNQLTDLASFTLLPGSSEPNFLLNHLTRT